MLAAHGWSSRRVVPHGGHQMSLNIAAGLHLGGNESYPDVFKPFGGFADGISVEGSYVGLPDIPGIGFEAKAALYAVTKQRQIGRAWCRARVCKYVQIYVVAVQYKKKAISSL